MTSRADQLAASVPLLSGRNILINPGFTINQGGYVSAATLAATTGGPAGDGYGHDSWKAGASGGAYSFTQLAGPTQITIAANKSLIQVVENVNVIGGAYVLSWPGTATARIGLNSATPSGNFAVSPILVSGQTLGTTMSVEFTGANAAGGSSVATNSGTLLEPQLELGIMPSSFDFRLYGTDLALCQRYCRPISGGYGFWQVGFPTTLFVSEQFPPMRAVPTPILVSGTNGALLPNVGTFNISAIGTYNPASTTAMGLLYTTATIGTQTYDRLGVLCSGVGLLTARL